VPHKFESIQKGLSALIIDRFNHQYSEGEDATYEATVDGWRVNPVRLDNLMIGDKGVSFELFVDAWNEKETNAYKSNTTSRFPLRITFDLTDEKLKAKTYSVPSETKRLRAEFLTDRVALQDTQTQIKVIHAIFIDASFDNDLIFLDIPSELMGDIRSYASGSQGVGSAVEGNFIRMLYLSGVTITTLGFGDIVPVTTPARILILTESVLGIVLIGLFLNALSYERGQDEGLNLALEKDSERRQRCEG
jgi:hypothetical protein